MEIWNKYIEENKERFLNELIELLKIPSISADSKYKDDVRRAAGFVSEQLTKAGAENVEICETPGHPIVYGDKIIDENLPTVLVYGHYDVQPPDPLELWDSPPFEPVVKDDTIYARGASDDKGQFYLHLKAFETMMNTNSLSCNVKFMIEGEEEVGSDNLPGFVHANKDRLAADLVLISDTAILSNEQPSITTGLRGLAYLQVEVTGPKRDLHSGIYGGAVANPINVLAEMISDLIDEQGRITIEGFYDDVVEQGSEFREKMSKAPFDLDAYKADLEIGAVKGEEGYSTLERTTIRPTLDVNGIWGGYTGEGAKTVLPSKAFAKISMRLVPNQNSDKIAELFQAHFEKHAPDYVKVKVESFHGGEPVMTPTDSIAYQAASRAMETTYGVEPIPLPSGGSIPIVALFEEALGIKTVLMGFGLDSDAIHSPNEHFGLFNYYKGIETVPHFFKNLTELSK